MHETFPVRINVRSYSNKTAVAIAFAEFLFERKQTLLQHNFAATKTMKFMHCPSPADHIVSRRLNTAQY